MHPGQSSNHIAAVGAEHLADHELRILTRKEKRRGRDVAWMTKAPDRRDRFYLLAKLVRDRGRHRRVDKSRRDAIDQNPEWHHFARDRFRKRDDPALRRAVV